jgi:hypothetical protein
MSGHLPVIDDPQAEFDRAEAKYLFIHSEVGVETGMVELIDGGIVKTKWGELKGELGSFLACLGPNEFCVIPPGVLIAKYVGVDEVSKAKIVAIRAIRSMAPAGDS